ncbi:MAG: pirin family protein, partial [Candidatus Thorarchaeota archaeon]|nr:pirin family protein [Candidatus Thorarchaeota archaeon]
FAYVFEGSGFFGEEKKEVGTETLAIFDEGEYVVISTQKKNLRLLLISGKPIGEPVAWYGPIVMNTHEELDIAFREYRNGTFIKHD